jgi:hypothetical protein
MMLCLWTCVMASRGVRFVVSYRIPKRMERLIRGPDVLGNAHFMAFFRVTLAVDNIVRALQAYSQAVRPVLSVTARWRGS